ncbi:hypothetical protein OLMES_4797 [Oleiphilus messinensis]|uniref:Amphi-Trp domain-containing protein n=1 Tax=Oleiphilus messinensis TaxID=141451 RepID=A0A1Y0IG34_9GAMM|nr:amphi-Trp domain-containing protein [Oleiphilus messinensis]ARU58786.1 hypothetical protein OLMES_4797 [Oleiphilus messinensis]
MSRENMSQNKDSFRHESLQDAKSIQEILKSITKGLAKGSLTFSDDHGEIVLEPKGLMNVKVTARCDDNRNRFDLRVSWQPEDKKPEKKTLNVRGG